MSRDQESQERDSFSESLVDECVLNYGEACRRSGMAMDMEPFLPDSRDRLPALIALASMALEWCWKTRAAHPVPEDRATDGRWAEYYLSKYPELNHPVTKLQLIRLEISKWPEARNRKEEYLARFRDVEGEVRTLFVSPSGTFLPLVSGFEIIREVAEGGMGVIYEAWQLNPRQKVALKMIRTAEFASTDDLARFKREAEAVAELDHPHITTIHFVGERVTANGRSLPYICMKWVEGETLRSLLSKHSKVPQAEKQNGESHLVKLLIKVAYAISHAHEQGVIHRDLKPENIIVTAVENSNSQVELDPHILDFGLAKRLHEQDGPNATRSGALVGTPHYMSPEQAEAKKASTKSDIYSLGVMLYEILTGSVPFSIEANGLAQLLQDVQKKDPIPPRHYNPKVNRDLNAVCLKCLEKRPDSRYETAKQLAIDLENWLASRSTVARPQKWVERTLKYARKRWQAFTFATAIVLLVAGIITQTLIQNHLSDENRRAGIVDRVAGMLLNGSADTLVEHIREFKEYGAVRSYPIVRLRQRTAVTPIVSGLLENSRRYKASSGRVKDLMSQWRENYESKVSKLLGNIPSAVDDELQEMRELAKETSQTRELQRLHKAVWRYRVALFECSDKKERSEHFEILLRSIADAEADDLIASLPILEKEIADNYQSRKKRDQLLERLGNGIHSASTRELLNHTRKALNHACFRATVTQDPREWREYLDDVALALVNQESIYFDYYVNALLPISGLLRAPLSTIAVTATKKDDRRFATLALIRYCSKSVETEHLIQAVLRSADPDVFELLRGEFQNFDKNARLILSQHFHPPASRDPEVNETHRLDIARRRVHAGLALALGAEPNYDFVELLKHAEDPTTRCLLIERLAGLNLDVASPIYLKLLGLKAEERPGDKEALVPASKDTGPTAAVRSAGVMVVGSLAPGKVSAGDQRRLQPYLRDWYWNTADPELHSACAWLLKKWKIDPLGDDSSLQESAKAAHLLDDRFAKALQGERRWYLAASKPEPMAAAGNGQVLATSVLLPGRTMPRRSVEMVLFKGPIIAELGTLSPAVETELQEDKTTRDREPLRWRKLNRSFAIAAFEVTVEDYLRFIESADYELLAAKNPSVFPPRDQFTYRKLHSPTLDSPINGVSWFQAIAFTNWLSGQHDIPEDQWCIPRADWPKIGPGMAMPNDYLKKKGYRLPTEAEWEYACRGGSRTSRPCGARVLLEHYACYAETTVTSDIARMNPVGTLKPNPFGLFDMLGNGVEWVMEPALTVFGCDREHAPADIEWTGNIKDIPTRIHRHVMRGGSFYQFAPRVRSAYRYFYQPTTTIENGGFRIARTLSAE